MRDWREEEGNNEERKKVLKKRQKEGKNLLIFVFMVCSFVHRCTVKKKFHDVIGNRHYGSIHSLMKSIRLRITVETSESKSASILK